MAISALQPRSSAPTPRVVDLILACKLWRSSADWRPAAPGSSSPTSSTTRLTRSTDTLLEWSAIAAGFQDLGIVVAARESPSHSLSLLSLHRALPAVHLAFSRLDTFCTSSHTFDTPDTILSTSSCLLACDIRCCWSVGMSFSFWILTSCCFLDQLETCCCLYKLIVFGVRASNARDRFSYHPTARCSLAVIHLCLLMSISTDFASLSILLMLSKQCVFLFSSSIAPDDHGSNSLDSAPPIS